MYAKQYAFALRGETPLIAHADNIEWADQMEIRRDEIKQHDKGAFKAGDDRCPPEAWKGCLYHDGTQLCVPAEVLRPTMMKAGAKITLKRNTTFKSLSQSALIFDDAYYPLTVGGRAVPLEAIEKIEGDFKAQADAVAKLGFKLLVKRAAVGQSKHVRVRPIFHAWEVHGVMTVIDKQLTRSILEQLWTIAGTYIGIGDWRPSAPRSPGPYGRFSVELKET